MERELDYEYLNFTRRKILEILYNKETGRAYELRVHEIAERLGKGWNATYHHLRILRHLKFIESRIIEITSLKALLKEEGIETKKTPPSIKEVELFHITEKGKKVTKYYDEWFEDRRHFNKGRPPEVKNQ